MALIGKLHPLLVHFPIALVMAAAAAELVAIATPRHAWHTVAVANLRAGAGAALLSSHGHVSSGRSVFVYRVALFGAAFLVAITGHLGGTLVWGAEFFRP